MYSMKIDFDNCKEEDLNNFMDNLSQSVGAQAVDENVYLMVPNRLLHSVIKQVPEKAKIHL